MNLSQIWKQQNNLGMFETNPVLNFYSFQTLKKMQNYFLTRFKGRVAILEKITLPIKFAILINNKSIKNSKKISNFLKMTNVWLFVIWFSTHLRDHGNWSPTQFGFHGNRLSTQSGCHDNWSPTQSCDHGNRYPTNIDALCKLCCVSSELLMQPDVKGREIIRWAAPRSTIQDKSVEGTS